MMIYLASELQLTFVSFFINDLRSYLLITVSMLYVKLGMRPKKDTLLGLTEMCNQEEHPLKGLFLRYYLLRCSKEMLHDAENER